MSSEVWFAFFQEQKDMERLSERAQILQPNVILLQGVPSNQVKIVKKALSNYRMIFFRFQGEVLAVAPTGVQKAQILLFPDQVKQCSKVSIFLYQKNSIELLATMVLYLNEKNQTIPFLRLVHRSTDQEFWVGAFLAMSDEYTFWIQWLSLHRRGMPCFLFGNRNVGVTPVGGSAKTTIPMGTYAIPSKENVKVISSSPCFYHHEENGFLFAKWLSFDYCNQDDCYYQALPKMRHCARHMTKE